MAAHFSGHDSVDGGEIRYEENTRYNATFKHAKSEWNAVGGVDFKGDSATTNADLEIKDVDRPSAAWAGRYHSRPYPKIDLLELEINYMSNTSGNNMKNVMVHEMGHALGLDDHESTSWKNIMYYAIRGWTTVRAHDETDYKSLW